MLLHRMLFGELSQGRWLPHTRMQRGTCIEHEDRLTLADHVYIGPFNFIEASGGVTMGEGVQITTTVSIVTHSSHRAQRLLAKAYRHCGRQGSRCRAGWRGRWHIGPGASSARTA
jgi:acetyltransferase-like isoleucine patch superfamily enzyme